MIRQSHAKAQRSKRSASSTGLLSTLRLCVKQSSQAIKRQIFNISLNARDRRLDDVYNFESELACGTIHFLDDARPLRRIAHDSAASNFPTPHFKLRLDERYDRSSVNY